MTAQVPLRLTLALLAMLTVGCFKANQQRHYRVGLVAFDQGRYAEAATAFATDYRRRGTLDALFNHALSVQKMGRLDDAVDLYQRYLEKSPGDAAAHLNLAQCFVAQKKHEQAVTHFEAAISHGSDQHFVHSAYGDYLLEREGHKSAERIAQLAERAVQLDNDPHAYYIRARTHLLKGQREAARADLLRATQQEGVHVRALLDLGRMVLEDGHPDRALRHFVRAGVLMPREGRAYAGAGLCYILMGRLRDGLQSLWRSRGLQVDGALLDAAEAYAGLGLGNLQSREALQRREALLVLIKDPQNFVALGW